MRPDVHGARGGVLAAALDAAVEPGITGDIDQCLASAFDHAPIGMAVIGPDGRMLRANDAYCRMLGYQRHELLAMSIRDVTHPEDVDEDINGLSSAAAGGRDSISRIKRYLTQDGMVLWVDARSAIVRDIAGSVGYTVLMVRDITEERRAEDDLRNSEHLLRSIVDDSPSAISVQGLDRHYRLINRSFEHRFGVEVGSIVSDHTPEDYLPPEMIARDCEDHYRVLQSGQAVRREEEVLVGGTDRVHMTHKFPLRYANRAIHAVCTVVNDVTDRSREEAELRDRLEWTDRIHTAAARDGFVLYGQPIMNLVSRDIQAAELLVRLRDRRSGSPGPIPPNYFVPAAERLGLISVIDQWVVARAVQLAMNRRVEVNVSAQTISDPQQVSKLERLVRSAGVPPGNITFEITEIAVAENISSVRAFTERLHEIGCLFALDDFGTGFGTFTYLKHLPVDYLKVDIEFVRDAVLRANATETRLQA